MRYSSGILTDCEVKSEPTAFPKPSSRRRISRTNDILGRLWKTGMGLTLMAVGGVFVLYLWNSYKRAAALDDWIPVTGEILRAEVVKDGLNQRGMTKYLASVRYEYTFEGTRYDGDRLARLPVTGSDPAKLAKRIKPYQVGEATLLYVNPAAPAESMLKKDTKAALYSIWFPCLFVIGGAGMVVSALLVRNRVG
jgi:Protein of unknown function (DUF3592)